MVPVTVVGSSQIESALPSGEVDVVLDVLEGRSPAEELPLSAPDPPEAPGPARGADWCSHPRVVVSSRPGPPGDGDVADQLSRCLDDVVEQLARSGLSMSDLVHLEVRTTDSHAVGAHVGVIAARLREAGETTPISMLAVDQLAGPGQVVQLEGTAVA